MATNLRGATTDSARPGLPLPLEIVIKIVKHCEDYTKLADDVADDDYAYAYTYDKDKYEPYYDEDDDTVLPPWMIFSKSAKFDIRNVRLVCKQFEQASTPSFGTLIGDRAFRFTRTGIQDLRNIAANEALVPWMKALTFETVELVESQCPAGREHNHYQVTGSRKMYHREATNFDEALESL